MVLMDALLVTHVSSASREDKDKVQCANNPVSRTPRESCECSPPKYMGTRMIRTIALVKIRAGEHIAYHHKHAFLDSGSTKTTFDLTGNPEGGD